MHFHHLRASVSWNPHFHPLRAKALLRPPSRSVPPEAAALVLPAAALLRRGQEMRLAARSMTEGAVRVALHRGLAALAAKFRAIES